jgi:hypothetical protein
MKIQEHEASTPMAGCVQTSRVYHFDEEGMTFYVTFTHHPKRVERWIHHVKEKYHEAAPTKCVDLD